MLLLEFEIWFEIWFLKTWDLAVRFDSKFVICLRFKSYSWGAKLWDLRLRSDLRFAHQSITARNQWYIFFETAPFIYSLLGEHVCLLFTCDKICIMISLKLLYSPLSIPHSCAVISRHHMTTAFIKIRALCLVSSRSVSSRHAASKLNRVHCMNASHLSVFRRYGTAHWFSSQSASSDDMMTVFDRNTKRKQRNRTADLPDYHVYDYLKDEVY